MLPVSNLSDRLTSCSCDLREPGVRGVHATRPTGRSQFRSRPSPLHGHETLTLKRPDRRDRHSQPVTDATAEVNDLTKGCNLCRCGSHVSILAAVVKCCQEVVSFRPWRATAPRGPKRLCPRDRRRTMPSRPTAPSAQDHTRGASEEAARTWCRVSRRHRSRVPDPVAWMTLPPRKELPEHEPKLCGCGQNRPQRSLPPTICRWSLSSRTGESCPFRRPERENVGDGGNI